MRPTLAFLLAAVAVAGCTDRMPGAIACPELVQVTYDGPEPVKLDLLLVVSVSPTMCDEQLGLEQDLATLAAKLDSAAPNFDLRVAVTSTDLGCPGAPAATGRLNRAPAKTLPAECGWSEAVACTQDTDCEVAGEEGLWRCERPADDLCITRTNGAITSRCRRTCDSDQECVGAREDPAFVCRNPGEASWSICQRPPATAECPPEVGPILTHETLDLLPCLGNVGVHDDRCARSEQGFGGALAALEPGGADVDAFRRRDAYLFVLFYTDGDDCSTPPGNPLTDDELGGCAFGPTTNDGGALLPVAEVANRLRALADDPAKVLVGVVGGDSLAPEEVDRGAEREAFRQAAIGDACEDPPYVCETAWAVAGWSSRYRALASAFGFAGLFANACSPEGRPPLFDDVVARTVEVVQKLCLPAPLSAPPALTVTRRSADGSETPLVDDVDYRLFPSDPACPEAGPALILTRPSQVGEALTVSYTPPCE